MPDDMLLHGVLYSNILLKLYLKSLKHGGRLQLDEDIPYTAQMIATITRQQIGTVERALQIFLKLGLVEALDSGTFYMSNIELLIGQSSTEAERKRAARLQNKALSALRTSGGHLSDIRPPEIELEKEIEINREIEKGHPAPAYGRYQNVFLTDGELADLHASFPTVWGQYIEKLSEYMASTGKRYQSHAASHGAYQTPKGTDPFGERSTMNKEPRTMQVADAVTASRAPENTPEMVKKISKTTYKVHVHFSNTSTETMSDKIKRMLKKEIQQMRQTDKRSRLVLN